MHCPYCRHEESKVLESRTSDGGATVRRRRECEACAKRFTTYERCEERPLIVVKKDGRREIFSRSKLLGGLMRACEKRPIATELLEEIAERLERELAAEEHEVESALIGTKLLEELFRLDEVAYIRFASVYLQFGDIDRFKEEIEKLVNLKT